MTDEDICYFCGKTKQLKKIVCHIITEDNTEKLESDICRECIDILIEYEIKPLFQFGMFTEEEEC